jgi:hypothetical protein
MTKRRSKRRREGITEGKRDDDNKREKNRIKMKSNR